MESCSPEMMREHERRITENSDSTKSAHKRMDNIVELVGGFMTEMRDMNKNIHEMNVNQSELISEVRHISKATDKHAEDIEKIMDEMETKDRVEELKTQLIQSDRQHERGMDAVMKQLRANQKALEDHKQEPAKEALAREKALKKWLIVSTGAIIVSVVTAIILAQLIIS